MAKKKKSASKPRRRRVGSVGSGIAGGAMEAGGLVLGSVLSAVAQRQLTSVNPRIVSVLQLAGGYFLKNAAKTPLMRGVGYGAMAAGAMSLTHSVGLISGIEEMVNGIANDGYVAGGEEIYLNDGASAGGLNNSSYVAGADIGGINNSMRVAGAYDGGIPAVGF